jgi:hypothetical protein
VGADLSDGPSNYRIIRYADVLLMAAEAANEIGDSTSALTYLNMVRARVDMQPIPYITQGDLRTKIWRERRIELAMEGLRFFDLVRQGNAATAMKAVPEGAAFRAGVNEVFPVPQTEIDMSNGKITQNPGY